MANVIRAWLGFCGMKWLGVLLLPSDESPWKVTLQNLSSFPDSSPVPIYRRQPGFSKEGSHCVKQRVLPRLSCWPSHSVLINVTKERLTKGGSQHPRTLIPLPPHLSYALCNLYSLVERGSKLISQVYCPRSQYNHQLHNQVSNSDLWNHKHLEC